MGWQSYRADLKSDSGQLMIIYITYNEAPSGIFSSQVIDVVKFLNKNFDAKVRLLSFISIRGYSENKKKIKQELPDAIVLPMFPKMQNWRKNIFLLGFFCGSIKPKMIIARSVMATKLALLMRDKNKCAKVVYDGRGAIEAEWKEYKVITNENLLSVIGSFEKEVVLKTDFRIAVSNALLEFWKKTLSYSHTQHVVIPCTLNHDFEKIKLSKIEIQKKREQVGLLETDCVFVYSGSVAGWQSFEILNAFIEPILKQSNSNKIVFFSPTDPNLSKLQKLFPSQVISRNLKPNEVSEYLFLGDYGLLIREQSITNQVASPVKYAEYLASGLKVIISDDLGDYTNLTVQKNWGYVFNRITTSLQQPEFDEKQKISKEAIQYFSKQNYKEQYKQLLSA